MVNDIVKDGVFSPIYDRMFDKGDSILSTYHAVYVENFYKWATEGLTKRFYWDNKNSLCFEFGNESLGDQSYLKFCPNSLNNYKMMFENYAVEPLKISIHSHGLWFQDYPDGNEQNWYLSLEEDGIADSSHSEFPQYIYY
ncbi:hypothetical protein TRFO_39361 [Tritrichomonas foetus]|uniref:Uncharacterized protein n=1 Tax=Tritrichomonas foetus TaxID=1144522 RepID=A0A1J4J576_9EUKA|nr:hypothetical protein TRFO_39361 [Tritrichomonas foetus]|eukprot:OHS94432.1 hypothetical protein TRFO_39361 [Tritrichomonas foetus]